MIKDRTTLSVASRANFELAVKDIVGSVWQKKFLTEGDEVTITPRSVDKKNYLCSLNGNTILFITPKEVVDRLISEKQFLLPEKESSGINTLSLPSHAWKHLGRS